MRILHQNAPWCTDLQLHLYFEKKIRRWYSWRSITGKGKPPSHMPLTPYQRSSTVPLFKSFRRRSQQQQQLDGQGKARREAARRRNSECKINLSCRNSSRGNGSRTTAQRWLAGSAALRPMCHAAGQSPLRSRPTAIVAGGIWTT